MKNNLLQTRNFIIEKTEPSKKTGDTTTSFLGFVLILLLSISFVSCEQFSFPEPLQQPDMESSGGFYRHSYTWEYNYRTYNLNVAIPVATYEHYASLPFEPVERFDAYVYEDPGYPYLDAVDKSLCALVKDEHLDRYELAQFIASFVQSMPYGMHCQPFFDHPKSPAVLLAEGGAKDCKDGSICTSALLSKLGYKTGLILLPMHMALGISGLPGTPAYYLQDGVPYTFCETTACWPIGQVPDGVQGEKIDFVIPVNQKARANRNGYFAELSPKRPKPVKRKTSWPTEGPDPVLAALKEAWHKLEEQHRKEVSENPYQPFFNMK